MNWKKYKRRITLAWSVLRGLEDEETTVYRDVAGNKYRRLTTIEKAKKIDHFKDTEEEQIDHFNFR